MSSELNLAAEGLVDEYMSLLLDRIEEATPDEALSWWAHVPGAEALDSLLELGFTAAEALSVCAHDWGMYRLNSIILQHCGYRLKATNDKWVEWVETGYEPSHGTPERDADDLHTMELHTIGKEFYREGVEQEAINLLVLIDEAIIWAKLRRGEDDVSEITCDTARVDVLSSALDYAGDMTASVVYHSLGTGECNSIARRLARNALKAMEEEEVGA